MTGRRQPGPRRHQGRLAAAAALAYVALAGCGHAAASDATSGAGTAVCVNAAHVDRLTIDRLNLLHQNFHFLVPAQVTVTDAQQAQAVAKTLCALPPVGHRSYSCPADWGIRYQLHFAASTGKLPPVTAAATGCTMVTGLGPVRLISGLFGFWSVLGKAAGLSHPSLATFAGAPRT
jgi:transposase